MNPSKHSRRVQTASKDAVAAVKTLTKAVNRMTTELQSLARIARNSSSGSGAGRKRRALTPEARRFLKTQGRYLGLVRHLPRRHRARVKDLKARKGYESAIREALKLQAQKG